MTEGAPRIAHLTTVHQVDDDRIFVKECRSLAAAGFDVTLIGPTTISGKLDGVRITALPIPKGRLQRMTSTGWQVLRAGLSSGAQICHFHDPELIPVGCLLKLFGRQVVYDVHEDYPRDIRYKDWIRPSLRWLFAKTMATVEGIAARLFDGIVAVTPTIAARFPTEKTITLANFPALDEFQSVPDVPYRDRPFQVCYVGGLEARRGLFDMIDGAEMLQGSAGDQCLVLAGRFASPEQDAQSQARPGWQRVKCLGWIDRASVAHLLGNVRAGLVVLRSDPCFEQAYPVKLFEYMAAGLPVVASDFPLYREFLDDGSCGLLVTPADPSALASAIEWLFTRPEEAQEMGERGRQRVEAYYSWETESQKLIMFYNKITDRL